MDLAKRKWPNVSLLGVQQKLSMANWNAFLTTCYKNNDVIGLQKALYGIQADMSDLRKQGLDDKSIVNLFLRLQGSIEKTAKQLYRKIYPSNLDNPKNNIELKSKLIIKSGGDMTSIRNAKRDFELEKIAKKKRDAAFELFLKESRF